MIAHIKEIYKIPNKEKIISDIKSYTVLVNNQTQIFDIFHKSKFNSFSDFREKKIIGNSELELKYNSWLEMQEDITENQRTLSKNLELLLFVTFIDYIINYKLDIYFIAFSDFRGRNYHRSRVSPYASSIFRFLYNYGVYETLNNKRSIMDRYTYLLPPATKYVCHVL